MILKLYVNVKALARILPTKTKNLYNGVEVLYGKIINKIIYKRCAYMQTPRFVRLIVYIKLNDILEEGPLKAQLI